MSTPAGCWEHLANRCLIGIKTFSEQMKMVHFHIVMEEQECLNHIENQPCS